MGTEDGASVWIETQWTQWVNRKEKEMKKITMKRALQYLRNFMWLDAWGERVWEITTA